MGNFRYFFGTFLVLALSACASKTELPPLPPPGPSMCGGYTSYNYSKAAAAVEDIANLRAHNSNEAVHYDGCIANHPKLDPKRSGGPR
jgi:hypothetical protein